MKIAYSKQFLKTTRQLTPRLRAQLASRIELFGSNPIDERLNNHALHTPCKGSYSINIPGDYRAIYRLVDKQAALFTHVGTHSQPYR